jgi:hypothetical protein
MSGVECTCTATRHITHKRVGPSEDATNEQTLYVPENFQNFAILLQLRVQLHTPSGIGCRSKAGKRSRGFALLPLRNIFLITRTTPSPSPPPTLLSRMRTPTVDDRPDKMMNSIALLLQTSLWYLFVLAKKAGIMCSRHT